MIFVRHGGTCVRVHRLRLRKVNTEKMDQCAMADSENDTNIEQGQDVAGQAASDIALIEHNTRGATGTERHGDNTNS